VTCVTSMSPFVNYITVTYDITPLFLPRSKIKKKEKKTPNKIKRKKIKPKGKYNRVQPIVHNF